MQPVCATVGHLRGSKSPSHFQPVACITVLPQSFPHLWIKLWKILGKPSTALFPGPILADFGEGEAQKAQQLGTSGHQRL